jgi:hypothetical protein
MATIFTSGQFQAIGNDGKVVPYGKLYFYEAGTLTPVNSYTTALKDATNTIPVVISASGKADVFLDEGVIDIVLKDSLDVVVWTIENYKTSNTFDNTGTGLAATNNQEAIEEINVKLNGSILNPEYKIDTIADLRLMTELPSTVWVTGYHTANDGAFGSHFFRLATDTGQVDNGGTIIRTVNGVYELQYDGAVNAKWFGVASSSNLLTLLLLDDESIVFDDEYIIETPVSVTLLGNKKLLGNGCIKFSSNIVVSNRLLDINTNGNSLYSEISFDGSDKIHSGIRVLNTTSMTGTLPGVHFNGGEHKGYYKDAVAGFGNYNCSIQGSYESVLIENVISGKVGRASGTGVSGSTGTNGFLVTTSGLNYAKKVTHRNNIYKDIYSNEIGANDVDADYFACFSPDPTNFPSDTSEYNEYPKSNVESYGNEYYNPIGRAEKHQCVPSVHNITIHRTGGRCIDGGSTDINLQWGVGIVRDVTINLSSVGGISPITTLYIPISFYNGVSYGESKSIASVSDVVINNTIETSLNNTVLVLVDFRTSTGSQENDVPLLAVKNISMLSGSCDSAIGMNFNNAIVYAKIDNIVANINSSIVSGGNNNQNVTLSMSNISNISGIDVVTFAENSTTPRTFSGIMTGHSNFGVYGVYSPQQSTSLPMIVGGALSANNNSNSGAVSVQAISLADTATHTFDGRGSQTGVHLIMVSSNFGGLSCIANCKGASAAISTIFTDSIYVFGTGSSPSTAGKLNIWVDATGSLNFENLLGSSRIFTVMFMG